MNAQTELSLQNNLLPAFATPVAVYQWPDSKALNSELVALVLALEAKGSGVGRSNVGGWHSGSDFLHRDAEPLRVLRERVLQMARGLTRSVLLANNASRSFVFRFDGWANVSRDGDYHAVHNHPGSLWSGTYYVSSGEPATDSPVNGRLELVDPRAGTNMFIPENTKQQGRFLITPMPGLMVTFPSWMLHMVHPFRGRGTRISIAFNIVVAES